MTRYAFLADRDTFSNLEGATVVEYDERDRGPFEGFYRRALEDGDGQTIHGNADRILFLDSLFDGLTFAEIGTALDNARTLKGTAE